MLDRVEDLQILVQLEEAVSKLTRITPRGVPPSWSEIEKFVEYARVKVHRDGELDLNRVQEEVPGLQPVADFLREHPGLISAYIAGEAAIQRTEPPSQTDIMDAGHPQYVKDYEAFRRYYPEFAEWEKIYDREWRRQYPGRFGL